MKMETSFKIGDRVRCKKSTLVGRVVCTDRTIDVRVDNPEDCPVSWILFPYDSSGKEYPKTVIASLDAEDWELLPSLEIDDNGNLI